MRSKTFSRSESKKLKSLGKSLKAMRKSRGLTQAEIGELIGVRRETYAKCENGQRQLKALELLTIRNALGEDPFECADLLQDKPVWAPRPLARRKQQRGAKAIASSWSLRMAEFRSGVITMREKFELERYSAWGRRRNAVTSTAFCIAAFAACIRMLTMEFDLPFAAPPGAVDWSLLISFVATVVLMPFQLAFFAKFAIWYKGQATT